MVFVMYFMNVTYETEQQNQFLMVKKEQSMEMMPSPAKQSPLAPPINHPLETNFNICVYDPYVFILLHLRSEGKGNQLHVQIPSVAIWAENNLYDIVYYQNNRILSGRNNQAKLTIKSMYKHFRNQAAEYSVAQPILVQKLNNETQLIGDLKFYGVSCKIKTDDFFNHLLYIQNKLPPGQHRQIVSVWTGCDQAMRDMARERMVGWSSDFQMDQQQYINLLNHQIYSYLSYQRNIELKHAQFTYTKISDKQYYLTNVQNLHFHNYSPSVKQYKHKLITAQQRRNRIIEITSQKQQLLNSLKPKPQTKSLQQNMNNQLNKLMRRINMSAVSNRAREEVNNELAWKKLHPKCKFKYGQVVQDDKKREEILGVLHPRRKLTEMSPYMRKYYNKVKHPKHYKTVDVII